MEKGAAVTLVFSNATLGRDRARITTGVKSIAGNLGLLSEMRVKYETFLHIQDKFYVMNSRKMEYLIRTK